MLKLFNLPNRNSDRGSASLKLDTDMHCHILPGIDDGPADLDGSLNLIKQLYDLGIRKIVATPHVRAGIYPNTPSTINESLHKVQQGCRAMNLDMEIRAAGEYRVDNQFLEILRNKQEMLPVFNDLLLVELPFATEPFNLAGIAKEINGLGYSPLLAHPERYSYYLDDFRFFQRVKEMGFKFQVNLLSLAGAYGKTSARAARYLFDRGMVDYVGSDLHTIEDVGLLSKNTLRINACLSGKAWNSEGKDRSMVIRKAS